MCQEKSDASQEGKRAAVAPPVRKSSAVLGVLLILLTTFVWYETASYPEHLLDARKTTGPGTFPRILTVILGLIGVREIVRASRTGNVKFYFPDKKVFYGSKNIWIVIAMTALFIPLTRYLGFAFGSMIYMLVLMACLKAKPWQAILTSCLAVVFVVIVFNYVFRVQLPIGVLTEPLGWRY